MYVNNELKEIEENIDIFSNEVKRIPRFRRKDGESCFQAIFYLQNNEYDVSCLRRITSQTFCNAIMHNDSFAYRCIEQYMGKDVIWKVPKISSWKDCMI